MDLNEQGCSFGMLNLCWYAAAKVLFQYGISGICTQYSQDNFWIILHVSLIIQPVLKG